MEGVAAVEGEAGLAAVETVALVALVALKVAAVAAVVPVGTDTSAVQAGPVALDTHRSLHSRRKHYAIHYRKH